MSYQETSAEALEAFTPHRPTVRQTIRDLLIFEQLTVNEIEDKTGLKHQTVSAEVSHMVTEGQLVDTGEKRKNKGGRRAIVWGLAVTPADADIQGKRRCPHCGVYVAADVIKCRRGHDVEKPLGTYDWVEWAKEKPVDGVPFMFRGVARFYVQECGLTYCIEGGCLHEDRIWVTLPEKYAFPVAEYPHMTHWRLIPE